MALNVAIMSIVSFLLGAVLISRGSGLAKRLKLMDVPGGRKRHRHPTPLMGGLTIMLVIAPLMIAYTLVYPYYFQSAIFAITSVGILIAGLAMFDDRVHISPIIRLSISAVFFGVAMWWIPGLQIGTVSWNGDTGHISLGRYTIALTVLSLIGFINAMNMADGKNGLVTGLCFGFSLILLISARSNLEPVIAILVGATFALFIYNLKGKIFLGDGGSYGLAALIGLFAIFVYQRSDILISADQVGLMFMIPVGDMGRLVITRMRAGKSPFEPDRDHLHHLLQDWLGWTRGLLLYLGLVFIPIIISLVLPSLTLILIAVTLVACLFVFWYQKNRGHEASSPNQDSLTE